MIKIYTSNNFKYLIQKICTILNEKKNNKIFIKEIFVLDDLEKSEVIKKKISQILGISSNIYFFTQEKFIFYILKKFINRKKYIILKRSDIFWECMNLSKKYEKKIYQIKKNELEKFQYLKFFSKIFYEYLNFRPNWIIKWEKKEKKEKKKKKKIDKKYYVQKKIWKKIRKNHIKKKIYHYINLYKKFFIKNFQKKYIYKKLPNKIFIFNPFNFPVYYFKILKKISKKINIYIILCTPFNLQTIKKKSWEKKSILSFITKNNLKKIKYIYSLSNNKKFFFEINQKNTLLEKIKYNFSLLQDNINTQKKDIKNIDDSLSIHECNNRLREIEILHDNILKILNNNKKLQPKDIIVKTENIQKYTPYIKSIFKNNLKNIKIPYNIHQSLLKNNSIIYIFNKILSLPDNKFKNEKILNFLYFKFISKKFFISKENLETIKKWIKNTNIRWGINSQHKKKMKIYPTSQNTWEYGIKKIILGYGIKENIEKWGKIRPYNIYEKDEIKLLEKIICFIETLKKWKKKLSTKKNHETWIKIYKKIIKNFFYLKKKNKKIIKIIKHTWIEMIKEIKNSSYKKRISIKILKYEFNQRIKKIYTTKKINNNCINFTNFSSLRTINFKITYCLGMNHNQFPKKIIKNNENLIYKYKKFGDPKKKEEQYFLFFELLFFTKKKFYISYINNSPNKIEKNEISSVIKILKKYIKNNFYLKKKKILSKIFFIHPKTDFEKKNFCNNHDKNTFQSIWILKNKNCYQKKHIKKLSLPYKINKIYFHKLITFWKNPINYFFNKILKIYCINKKFIDYNKEPFQIDPKNNYLIQEKILKYMLLQKNLIKLFKKIKSIGILPHKNFGEIYFQNQTNKIKTIFEKIKKFNTKISTKKFLLKIKKFKIYGKLKNISSNGLLKWKTSPVNYYDIISLWIEHMIYCLLGGKKSTYIGCNKTISFKQLSFNQSKKYLLRYIFGYIQGLKNPLLLTKTGLCWFHYIFDKKKKKIYKNSNKIKYSEKKMLEIWNGNKYFLGEKKNLYIKKIIPSLNINILKKIKRITKYWMTPIYKNII